MLEFFSYFTSKAKIENLEDYFELMTFDVYEWTLFFAVLMLLVEWLDEAATRRLTTGRFLESLSSLFTQIPFYIAELFVFSATIYLYFIVHAYIPWQQPITLNQFLFVLLLADFTYYVEHFCMHKVRVFWVAHSVHHSSSVMNTATAFRFSIFDPVLSAMFHFPLVLMGFNPILIFAAEILVQVYQFWIHNEMVGKLGPLEWIFNTPSHHRVHHGSDDAYVDTNYGGILIIWDRLFGTFAEEKQLPTYGLSKPMTSINPITVQFHELFNLMRDLGSARTVRSGVAYLLKPPGWTEEKGKT